MTNDQDMRRIRFVHWGLVICWSLALGHSSPARADTLFISSGGGNPVQYANVKVLRIAGGQIVYTLASGTENRKPLEQVVRMQIDDEPALNAAEQAFFTEKWND